MKQDVTIIGGGPAGSTAAILLARAGWDVTLIEQRRFPRSKVCGECLSAMGFEVLTRLGVASRFVTLGAVQLCKASLFASTGTSVDVALPAPMWGLSRDALDELLLESARNAGATVRQPVRCESLADQTGCVAKRSPGSVGAGCQKDPGLRFAAHPAWGRSSSLPVITLRDLSSNVVETVTPSHVILADGKAAFASDPPMPTGDLGIKTHFENIDGPRDVIELFGVAGSYGGLAAIEGNRWNAAFSVPAARVRSCRGNIDALFQELVSENRMLSKRLNGAKRCSEWLASPLPRFPVRRRWAENVIPVGNAAAALEPIGGEGMGLAMRSAELAVESMLSGSIGRTDTLANRYRKLWRTRQLGCRAAALAVSQPAIGNALLRQSMPPMLARAAMKMLGK